MNILKTKIQYLNTKLFYYMLFIFVCAWSKFIIETSILPSRTTSFLLSNFLTCFLSLVLTTTLDYYNYQSNPARKCFTYTKIGIVRYSYIALISFSMKLLYYLLTMYFNPLLLSTVAFFKLNSFVIPRITDGSPILSSTNLCIFLKISFFTVLTIFSQYKFSLFSLILFLLYLYLSNLKVYEIFLNFTHSKKELKDKKAVENSLKYEQSLNQSQNNKENFYNQPNIIESDNNEEKIEPNQIYLNNKLLTEKNFDNKFCKKIKAIFNSFPIFSRFCCASNSLTNKNILYSDCNVTNIHRNRFREYDQNVYENKQMEFLNEYGQDLDVLGAYDGLKIQNVEVFRCLLFGILFCLSGNFKILKNSLFIFQIFVNSIITCIVDFILLKVALQYQRKIYRNIKLFENIIKLFFLGLRSKNPVSVYQIGCIMGIVMANYLIQTIKSNK